MLVLGTERGGFHVPQPVTSALPGGGRDRKRLTLTAWRHAGPRRRRRPLPLPGRPQQPARGLHRSGPDPADRRRV